MSQFYFATLTSTTNMVTLATLLTATTFKTEALRQMKRKPDQLQSKINRQLFKQQL
jgi:vacuolar-type H+-ATPase subunit C/Vma6